MDQARELLDEMERALERLRGIPPNNAQWRIDARNTAAALARGAAGLLELLDAQERTAAEGDLRAQRFASVRVAEIQLYHAAEVKTGRTSSDLYGVLRPALDAARAAYTEQFLTPVNGVPDYLHQEIVKTLANNDAKLLGPQYPGPLV